MAAFIVMLLIIAILFISPWAEKKIRTALNDQKGNYRIEVDKIHVSLLARSIKLERITFATKDPDMGKGEISGKIEAVNCRGIRLAKLIFRKNFEVGEIIIKNGNLEGKIPFKNDSVKPVISTINLQIDKVFFDNINFSVQDTLSPQTYTVKNGDLTFLNLQIIKNDTLSKKTIQKVDLSIPYFSKISDDSLNTIYVKEINYSSGSNLLTVDSFINHPNFEGYEFTDKKPYLTSRMEAVLSKIIIHDFAFTDCIHSGDILSSYVEIGHLNLEIFKDARKELKHVKRPMLQEMIYNYPNKIQIDSLRIHDGDIIYTEHATEANMPGTVRFNKMEMQAYKITNDTIYKKEKAWLEIIAKTLIMGKGEFRMDLKAELFETDNTFTFNGSATPMDAADLNPILEKNAYVYANTGRVDGMSFSFSANNFNSTGTMIMLYHDLNLSVKNKQTDKTTAIKERIISFITNMKVKDANPLPGQEVRTSEIYFERNTEKYMINYCFKSILSGVLTTIINDNTQLK